jgi:DNA primase
LAYIVFDQDENQAGQQASQQLAFRLQRSGGTARIVKLPAGHDPSSYFVAGATAADFTALLAGAQRL